METKNFLSDALELIQELNKANGKELSKEEKEQVLNKLDEFSTAFIYFRESYDESKSNVHQLAEAIEDIREVVSVGETQYTESDGDLTRCNKILLTMVGETMDKLEMMNDLINDAKVEESQHRQLNAIKDIFIETKKQVQGSEVVFRTLEENIIKQSNGLKDSMETVGNQLRTIENNAIDIKTHCDEIKQTEDVILKAFKEWEIASQPEIQRGFNDILDKVEREKREYEEQKRDEVKEVDLNFDKAMTAISDKSLDVIKNLDVLVEKSDHLLTGEGVKQFLIYGGTALTGLNFLLLMAMFFIK